MQNGFTFLELVMALGIIALVALWALPHYEGFFARHEQKTEVEQLVRVITLARQEALLRQELMTVCPLNGDMCGNDWSLGLLLLDGRNQVLSRLVFENKAQIFLKTFPAGSEAILLFSANGQTHAQNGSFYYCADKIEHAQRIVFNQAGRVYVTQEGALDGCEG